MARRNFEVGTGEPWEISLALKAVLVPRPIAWVSTISAEGVANLAPHSFFTAASEDPPIVLFTSIGDKDTLANVTDTGEFVISMASAPLVEQVNRTATDYPPDVDEFEQVGLVAEPSEKVAPPRVADSPVAIECVTETTLSFGTATVVFGRVVLIAVDEAAMEGDHPSIAFLEPLARLGRNEWSRIGEVFRLDRIPWSGEESG